MGGGVGKSKIAKYFAPKQAAPGRDEGGPSSTAAGSGELCAGTVVELAGLPTFTDLNGRRGKLQRFEAADNKWIVDVEGRGPTRVHQRHVRAAFAPPRSNSAPVNQFIAIGASSSSTAVRHDPSAGRADATGSFDTIAFHGTQTDVEVPGPVKSIVTEPPRFGYRLSKKASSDVQRSPAALCEGAVVELTGFVGDHMHLNGQSGILQRYDVSKGRWFVDVAGVLLKLDVQNVKLPNVGGQTEKQTAPSSEFDAAFSCGHREDLASDRTIEDAMAKARVELRQWRTGEAAAQVSNGSSRWPAPRGGAADAVAESNRLVEGSLVEINGLTSASRLNGLRGKLMRYDAASGRWFVDVDGLGVEEFPPFYLKAVWSDVHNLPDGASTASTVERSRTRHDVNAPAQGAAEPQPAEYGHDGEGHAKPKWAVAPLTSCKKRMLFYEFVLLDDCPRVLVELIRDPFKSRMGSPRWTKVKSFLKNSFDTSGILDEGFLEAVVEFGLALQSMAARLRSEREVLLKAWWREVKTRSIIQTKFDTESVPSSRLTKWRMIVSIFKFYHAAATVASKQQLATEAEEATCAERSLES